MVHETLVGFAELLKTASRSAAKLCNAEEAVLYTYCETCRVLGEAGSQTQMGRRRRWCGGSISTAEAKNSGISGRKGGRGCGCCLAILLVKMRGVTDARKMIGLGKRGSRRDDRKCRRRCGSEGGGIAVDGTYDDDGGV